MASAEERGIEGHLSIDKARVWDLRSTGQVTTGGRTGASIACTCFHPTDPTLCVVTVQGSVSVLSFYNAHSGGKMSTLPLQSVVVAAQFSKDGNKIVVIFRDWTIMMLRPGSPVWSKTVVPFKKDTRPAENLMLALSPAQFPVIYFASAGTQKLNVVYSQLPTSKSTLLSSSQKQSFATKLSTASLMSIACHPEEDDILIGMFSDGSIQGFALEQGTLKKLFSFGEGSHGHGHGVQLEVLSHPFIPGAALILAAAGQQLSIYATIDRTDIEAVDALELRNYKRINGIGMHREARVMLAFGELPDGKLVCTGARFSGSKTSGVSLVPVNISFSASALDVMVPNHSVSGIANVSDRGSGCSWMELWDAVPTWAQSASHMTSSRQRIRSVKIHSVMGAIAAQSTTTGSGPYVLLWSISDASHPLGGSHIGLVIPQHTSLSLWAGQSTTDAYDSFPFLHLQPNSIDLFRYKLEFPHHCYFVSGAKLSGFGLRSKRVTDLISFHPPTGTAGPAMAETVVYSTVHRAWLIFFRSFSTGDDSHDIEEWTYTVQREDEIGASPPWFKPGMSGVFIGPKEDHCCILDPDLYAVHVYPTKLISGKSNPLLSLSLPSPGLLTPAIFQGPPITQIPKPPPVPEFTSSGTLIETVEEEEEGIEKVGYGVIIWVNRFNQIAMGTMMSELTGRRTWHESESVEFIQGGTFYELSEGEIVIQVAWQVLSEEDEAHRAPNSFTAAVLTNQRLMLFLANGYPVLSFPPQNSPGLTSPPMSCLWVGPALLYVTRTGEVNQLLWDGTTVMICGAPSTTGSAVLAAALADRILFLCRETESQSWQVATRHAIMGYALLMGWASLASSGLMPPAWLHAHARNQMKIVMQHFDSSTVSAPVARTLVQSEFAEVARSIVNRWPKEAQDIKIACSVAARNWKEAAEGLMNVYQSSIYHPDPIPKGTTMWKRFYTVAMGAVRHNQADIGAELFAAAGEWEWSLIFYSISPSTAKISTVLNTAKAHLTSEEHQTLLSLTDQLRKRSIVNSGSGYLKTDAGAEFDDLTSWTFAATGYLAPMYCIQGETPNGMIKDGDIGLIDPLETTDIKGYVSGVSKKTTHGNFLRRTITASISGRGLLQKTDESKPSTIPESLEVGESSSFTPKVDQSPKRRQPSIHGFSEINIDERFSSDDEDNDDAVQQEINRSGATFSKKFKIQIKKKEERQDAASSEALREAAKNLRLGGLSVGSSLGPGGFAAAMKSGSGMIRVESVSSVSSEQSHVDPRLASAQRSETPKDPFESRPTSSPHTAKSSSSLHDTFKFNPSFQSGTTNAAESFESGVKEMEGGNWDSAIEAFSKPGVITVPRGKQYLAAVMLLKERASLTGSEAARLDRFAASLELEDGHRKRMTMQAVHENIQIGNYGYAEDNLNWLLESSKETLSPTVASTMQKQLQECQRHRSSDNNISPFENFASIASGVESALSVEDIRTAVLNLIE